MNSSTNSYREMLAIAPHRVDEVQLAANAAALKMDLAYAEDLFNLVLSANPQYFQAWCNLGNVLHDLHRWDEAIDCYQNALVIKPDYAAALFNRGFALIDVRNRCEAALMKGDYSHEWGLYARHWRMDLPDATRRYLEQRSVWQRGQSIAGKTILLWCIQGFGDFFQFCRYATQVEAMGAKVLLIPPRSMFRLMTISFASTGVIVVSENDIFDSSKFEVEFHHPLMGLPHVCGTDSIDRIPKSAPYLFADCQDSQAWSLRLAQMSSVRKCRIGLIWAGGFSVNRTPVQQTDANRRSLHLSQLNPLLDIAQKIDAQIFSLQVDESAKQLDDLVSQNGAHTSIFNMRNDLRDWADTAALIDNLDLVICCDTAVAHLAAAMGKPTWILLKFDACWRWLSDRDDSPWYPSVRLFRQTKLDEWNDVVLKVVDSVQRF